MNPKTITNTFYAEHTDDPKSWASPRPDFDVQKFQAELERRGGLIGSVPRFRLRWAGEHDEYIIEEYDTLEGYVYRDEKGIERFVKATEEDFEFPDGCVPAPHFEGHKVRVPRWVIEEYRGDIYHKFWTVQEIEQKGYESGRIDLVSHYRHPSEVDLQTIEAYIAQSARMNADDIRNLVHIEQAKIDKRRAEEHDRVVEEFAEDFDRAMKDGLPNAVSVGGFNPNLKVDITEHSKALIKEHDKKI